MKTDVKKIFGSNVFNDAVMKERLPKAAYKKMKATIEAGAELDPEVADIVAHEMKEWALAHHQHLSKKHHILLFFAFRQHSALTKVRHLIRRLRFFVLCRH